MVMQYQFSEGTIFTSLPKLLFQVEGQVWPPASSLYSFLNFPPNPSGLFKLPLQLAGTLEKDYMYLFLLLIFSMSPLSVKVFC